MLGRTLEVPPQLERLEPAGHALVADGDDVVEQRPVEPVDLDAASGHRQGPSALDNGADRPIAAVPSA
jgi:hypothetical protein